MASPRQTVATTAAPTRTPLAGALRAVLEGLLLTMTALAPWAFAAVHPASILILYLGLSAALIVWSLALLVERRVTLPWCPVLICGAGMVALGVWQLVPLDPEILATLSPRTAALRTELYPQELESMLGEEVVFPPATTISLDANATRARVVQLLALLAVFAVVRFGIARPTAFRRLAIVCVVNGSLLSLFALAQRFSSTPNTIYWSYPTLGSAYGPFVCKNHFPDYVNICLFLGIGLLLQNPILNKRYGTLGDWFFELARNPTALWLIAAVGLMVTAVLFSLSRGGAIALGAATIFCAVLGLRTIRFGASLTLLLLIFILAVGFIGWFGTDSIGQRLGTLSENDASRARREIWTRTFPLVGQFPIWGTGYGTFLTVEPQMRQLGDDQILYWEHAHNDYLEALIEGGLVHLLLLLLTVAFVYRSGLRAFRRLRNHPYGALLIGGLSGFTAVVLHSGGEFGLHLPAIALVVTVLAAHLTAFDDPADASPLTLASGSAGRWVVVPTVFACLVVALILPIDGWFRERADHFRIAAIRAANRLEPGNRDTVIRYLQAAVAYLPEDAGLRARLADAEYQEYLARRQAPKLDDAARIRLEETYLRPALRDYLCLRALNPLYEQPHARLAGNRQYVQHADSVSNYLARATRLRPTDASLWYLAGLERVTRGDLDRAWDDWRRSLTCSPAHVGDIVPVAIEKLGAANSVDRIFTASPELLLQAAQTPPLSERQDDRRAFAERASLLITSLPLTNPGAVHARAWLLREAGQTEAAIAAYEAALQRAPHSISWHFEMAELLFEKGQLELAERHLRQVLRESPDLPGAMELNTALVKAQSAKH